MRAYSELYLEAAQYSLGFMLEYAVYDVGLTLEDAWDRFIISGFAARFERGEPSVVVGRSGTELMYDVMIKTEHGWEIVEVKCRSDRTPEFWVGWAVAYVQWFYACSFQKILSVMDADELIRAYTPYHEMDISQFVELIGNKLREDQAVPYIKRRRLQLGISQRELAERSEVPLRTIQQYEQRQKNINHARAGYLVALARALSCRESKLLDRVWDSTR